MQPTLVGFSQNGTNGAFSAQNNMNIPVNSSRASGDLIMLCIVDNSTTTWNIPTGYTAIARFGVSGRHISLFWKISDGTETTVNVTSTVTSSGIAFTLLFRNTHQTTPIASHIEANDASSSTIHTSGTLATVGAKTIVGLFVGGFPASAPSGSARGSLNESVDLGGTSSPFTHAWFGYQVNTTATTNLSVASNSSPTYLGSTSAFVLAGAPNVAPSFTAQPARTYPGSQTALGSGQTATVTFTATDDSDTGANALTYQVRTASGGGGTLVASGTFTSGTQKSITIASNATGLAEGRNTLYIRALDTEGGATDGTSFTLDVDTTAPTDATSISILTTPTETGSTRLSFRLNDANPSAVSRVLAYEIRTASGGGGTLLTFGNAAATTTGQTSTTTTATYVDASLVNGSNTRYIRTIDPAGNATDTAFTVTPTWTDWDIIIPVAAAGDDLQFRIDGSSYNNVLTPIYAGYASATSLWSSIFRITNVTIPPGATIDAAQMQLTAGNFVSNAALLKIQAEAADNPGMTTSNADAKARVMTTASVSWTPAASLQHEDLSTPDISSVIQEIVNRPGWVSGNAINIFVINDSPTAGTLYRQFDAYDAGGPPLALIPRLAVSYTAGTAYTELTGSTQTASFVTTAGAEIAAWVELSGTASSSMTQTSNFEEWDYADLLAVSTITSATTGAAETDAMFEAGINQQSALVSSASLEQSAYSDLLAAWALSYLDTGSDTYFPGAAQSYDERGNPTTFTSGTPGGSDSLTLGELGTIISMAEQTLSTSQIGAYSDLGGGNPLASQVLSSLTTSTLSETGGNPSQSIILVPQSGETYIPGVTLQAPFVIVATTGNDTTGDGSVATPYRTIMKGFSVAQATPGTTVYIRAGTYTETNTNMTYFTGGSSTAGFKVTQYPGDAKPIIRSQGWWLNNARFLTLDNLEFTQDPAMTPTDGVLADGSSALTNDTMLKVRGGTDVTIQNCYLHDYCGHGLLSFDSASASQGGGLPTNILVRYNKFYNTIPTIGKYYVSAGVVKDTLNQDHHIYWAQYAGGWGGIIEYNTFERTDNGRAIKVGNPNPVNGVYTLDGNVEIRYNSMYNNLGEVNINISHHSRDVNVHHNIMQKVLNGAGGTYENVRGFNLHTYAGDPADMNLVAHDNIGWDSNGVVGNEGTNEMLVVDGGGNQLINPGFVSLTTGAVDFHTTNPAVVSYGRYAVAPQLDLSETTSGTAASPSTTAAITSVSTASWSPAAGDLIMVAVYTRPSATTHDSVIGNGITFTKVHDVVDGDNTTRLTVWRGMSTSPSTGSITATFGTNAQTAVIIADRFIGANQSGTNGSGAVEATASSMSPPGNSATLSVNITTLTSNAMAWVAAGNRIYSFAAGAGETLISSQQANAVNIAGSPIVLSTEYQRTTPAGLVTLDGSISTAQDWVMAAVSIKPATLTVQLYNETDPAYRQILTSLTTGSEQETYSEKNIISQLSFNAAATTLTFVYNDTGNPSNIASGTLGTETFSYTDNGTGPDTIASNITSSLLARISDEVTGAVPVILSMLTSGSSGNTVLIELGPTMPLTLGEIGADSANLTDLLLTEQLHYADNGIETYVYVETLNAVLIFSAQTGIDTNILTNIIGFVTSFLVQEEPYDNSTITIRR